MTATATSIPFAGLTLDAYRHVCTFVSSLQTDEKAGVLKVLLEPASERILGASVVGAEAGEPIHVFAALMQAGATARALVDMEAVHPSFAEGVQSVVMALPRYALP